MNSYDKYAKEWASDIRSGKVFSHDYIERPAMLAKLPDLKGKRVLCIGCGSGEECAELAKRGAQVVGIDSSIELIKIAKQSFPDIEFAVMDMEALDFPGESFDFIYSSLTMHYKEHWSKTLELIYRAMKPDSSFLFSTNHPLTWAAETIHEGVYKARLFGYEQTDGEMKLHGDYFTTRLLHDTWWGYFEVSVYTKPLSEIFQEIREANFEIVDFLEPKSLAKGKDVDPLQYARYQRMPLFMIFELKKRSA
jgi:SAM-dependent methyltransferase